jgi:hypothetical protein
MFISSAITLKAHQPSHATISGPFAILPAVEEVQ